MNKKVKLSLLLFLLGLIGVVSTLVQYPVEGGGTLNLFFDFKTLWQLNYSYLLAPTAALLIAVVVGTLLYDKVNLKLPVLESLVNRNQMMDTSGILHYGIMGGIIVGVLVTTIILVFNPILPSDSINTGGSFTTNVFSKVLNGGITLEIIHRFGWMTFTVWLIHKISGKLTPTVYWSAIIIVVVFLGAANLIPRYTILGLPTIALLSYHFLLSVSTIVYCWLYWKKGLETAMVAHMIAILVMTLGAYVFHL